MAMSKQNRHATKPTGRANLPTTTQPTGPVTKLSPAMKIALDALVIGKTINEAADLADIPAHELDLALFYADVRAALAQLRDLWRERVRDAAFYQLACLAGAIQDERYPPAPSDNTRTAALRSVLGIGRDSSQEKSAEIAGNATPIPTNRPPSLVITFGDKQEPRDITPTAKGPKSGSGDGDLS